MSSQPGDTSLTGTTNPQKQNQGPESPSRDSIPYKDSERDHGKPTAPRRSYDSDVEQGNMPLLPAESEDDFGIRSGHSFDSHFDYEDPPEQLRRDPGFSCSRSGFVAWLRGPTPPHVYHINPWFPRWQAAPVNLVDRYIPRMGAKIALLFLGLVFWMVVFFSSLKASVAGQEVLGYGQPIKLSCNQRLWYVQVWILTLVLIWLLTLFFLLLDSSCRVRLALPLADSSPLGSMRQAVGLMVNSASLLIVTRSRFAVLLVVLSRCSWNRTTLGPRSTTIGPWLWAVSQIEKMGTTAVFIAVTPRYVHQRCMLV